MKALKHTATGRVVEAHDKAVDVYLANGWETVDERKPADDSRRGKSVRKASQPSGDGQG